MGLDVGVDVWSEERKQEKGPFVLFSVRGINPMSWWPCRRNVVVDLLVCGGWMVELDENTEQPSRYSLCRRSVVER